MFSVTYPDWNAITECIPKFKTKGPYEIRLLTRLSFHYGLPEDANMEGCRTWRLLLFKVYAMSLEGLPLCRITMTTYDSKSISLSNFKIWYEFKEASFICIVFLAKLYWTKTGFTCQASLSAKPICWHQVVVKERMPYCKALNSGEWAACTKQHELPATYWL